MPTLMTHTFNSNFRADEWVALTDIAHRWRCSRSAVLRRLTMAAAAMINDGVPACASGAPCLAPQLHTHRPVHAQNPQYPRSSQDLG